MALTALASTLAGPLFGLIDKLFTSDDERAAAKQKLIEMEQSGQLAQIAVNLKEAESESVFVAGWRPFVGWTCGAALAYNYIVQPFASFAAAALGDPQTVDLINTLPELDLATMIPVLIGMLGLGGMRTYEKKTGSNKNR